MTEADLQKAVIDLAHTLGYRVHHTPRATVRGKWITPTAADAKGWPDLVIVGYGRLLFVELKSDRGFLRPEQAEWRRALLDAGARHCVFRPRDWVSGEIEAVLQ